MTTPTLQEQELIIRAEIKKLEQQEAPLTREAEQEYRELGRVNSPVTMSLFDQGISGAMMTSIAVSPSMAKMTATASVESD